MPRRFIDDGFGPCYRCKEFGRLNADNICKKCFNQVGVHLLNPAKCGGDELRVRE